MPHFKIRNSVLHAEIDPRESGGFQVKSTPRPYSVEWLSHRPLEEAIADAVAGERHPLLIVDRRVMEIYGQPLSVIDAPTMEVEATEELKSIEGALRICEFLDHNKATKASMLFVVGGGVVQDVAGFSCAIYKRGIPWTYIPSTLLAQGDSSMGGKAGLNYKGAKNILALFSSPRRVVIHTGFLPTLPEEDLLSGLGEIFRLHVTGGDEFVAVFDQGFKAFLSGDRHIVNELLVSALSVKRAVIELDEFELDIRRAMNYGHSIGHAIEALTNNRIPHGTAVVIGMLVENQISVASGRLSPQDRDRLNAMARPLVTRRIRDLLADIDLAGIVDVLGRDKKSEGSILKLALLHEIGRIDFLDFPLDGQATARVQTSLDEVLSALEGS